MIEQIAKELDFIYNNFWVQFSQLLHKIISERPANLREASLDFRCSKYNEINAPKELGSSSPIYRLILDIFSTELYTHCLIRKLAIFKIYQITILAPICRHLPWFTANKSCRRSSKESFDKN